MNRPQPTTETEGGTPSRSPLFSHRKKLRPRNPAPQKWGSGRAAPGSAWHKARRCLDQGHTAQQSTRDDTRAQTRSLHSKSPFYPPKSCEPLRDPADPPARHHAARDSPAMTKRSCWPRENRRATRDNLSPTNTEETRLLRVSQERKWDPPRV